MFFVGHVISHSVYKKQTYLIFSWIFSPVGCLSRGFSVRGFGVLESKLSYIWLKFTNRSLKYLRLGLKGDCFSNIEAFLLADSSSNYESVEQASPSKLHALLTCLYTNQAIIPKIEVSQSRQFKSE